MSALAGIVATAVAAVQTPAYTVSAPDDQSAFVAGVASAVGEATCTAEWSELVDCKPIWPASEAPMLVALVVTIGRFESGLDPRIGRTRCRLAIGECDAEGPRWNRRAGSIGYFQTKRFAFRGDELADALAGAGSWSVHVQARVAIRALAGAAGACRNTGASRLRAAISGYATGGGTIGARCYWHGAPSRERVVLRVLAAANDSTQPAELAARRSR